MFQPCAASRGPSVVMLVACFGLLSAARAQAPQGNSASLDPAGGGLGLKLQMERTLQPPIAPATEEELPIFLEADRIEGTQDRSLQARGSVIVRRRGQTLYADSLDYSLTENTLTATGNVRVNRLGDELSGDQAFYDLDTESGYIDYPIYRLREFGARGQANRIVVRVRDRLRAERATYTNCAVGNDDWYLRVNRLDLDRLRDAGVARNATVYFKGLPILYTPYLDFPLSSRRKTGFLPPSIGTTDKSGFEFTLPFYWNIAPNRDYTIAPRFLSRRGVLVDNEFRYLERNFRGEARAAILPDDRLKQDSRWAYSVQHLHRFSDRLTGYLDLQGVSDDTYFVDLSDQIAATSITNLPREGGMRYFGDWWDLLARLQRFQTLQDPLAPVTPPYARLPQILLNAARQNVGGFDLRFFGEAVNFDHPTQVSAIRQVYYPSVAYPMRRGFFYVTPKVGFNYTSYYYRDSNRPNDQRSLPIVSVDSGMTFERETGLFGRDFIQTLEPRLYYLYIPFTNQDQLPLFDTAVADFNLAQIFTENQFSGWDRINDANQLTAAVTSRLLEPSSGAEWVRATFGQRFYFKQQEVTLGDQVPRSTNRSDLLAAVTGSLWRTWFLDTGLQYSIDDNQSQKFNVALRHQPQPGKVVNLGYRFTRDVLEQVDVSAQWPLSRRWTGLARYNYSLIDSTLLEALIGLEYNAGCWVARVVAHRFVTGVDERSSTLFLQLELSGLSRLGSDPLGVLRSNIFGYTQAPARPPSPGPYYPGMEP
jgi:LPS-assembly protein